MSNTSSDNYSDEEAGDFRNAPLIHRLRQQRSVDSKELEGEMLEDYQSDSDNNHQKHPCGSDQKHFQLNEQQVNKGKHIKSSHHGNVREFFDSDSSEPVDILESHDQGSLECQKKGSQISSYNSQDKLEYHRSKKKINYHSDIMDKKEDRKNTNLKDSIENLSIDGTSATCRRSMAESRARRPEDRPDADHDKFRRDASPDGRLTNQTRPNVIITNADVHVDNTEFMQREIDDEYRQRRRKEKSDSQLHISYGNEQEAYESQRRSRTRSEPRKAIKHGKDEVNRAEKHVIMIDFERGSEERERDKRKNRQSHTTGKDDDGSKGDSWEKDSNFEYQQRKADHGNKRGKQEKKDHAESINRSRNYGSRDDSHDNEHEIELNDNKRESSKMGQHMAKNENKSNDLKTNAYKSESVEKSKKGNHSSKKELSQEKVSSNEDKSDKRQQGSYSEREQIWDNNREENMRYYTPQLERRQNRRKRGPLLSLVSEDDLSDSGLLAREFDKSTNIVTDFSPAGKAKTLRDVKRSRQPSSDDEFSMPGNKMGSFQDFRPMTKERSVSRISSINDEVMDEESTIEIEPWVDYLELEVGPILKYMQYPSFDSDEEIFEEEPSKQESEFDTDSENLEERPDVISVEANLDTNIGVSLKLDSEVFGPQVDSDNEVIKENLDSVKAKVDTDTEVSEFSFDHSEDVSAKPGSDNEIFDAELTGSIAESKSNSDSQESDTKFDGDSVGLQLNTENEESGEEPGEVHEDADAIHNADNKAIEMSDDDKYMAQSENEVLVEKTDVMQAEVDVEKLDEETKLDNDSDILGVKFGNEHADADSKILKINLDSIAAEAMMVTSVEILGIKLDDEGIIAEIEADINVPDLKPDNECEAHQFDTVNGMSEEKHDNDNVKADLELLKKFAVKEFYQGDISARKLSDEVDGKEEDERNRDEKQFIDTGFSEKEKKEEKETYDEISEVDVSEASTMYVSDEDSETLNGNEAVAGKGREIFRDSCSEVKCLTQNSTRLEVLSGRSQKHSKVSETKSEEHDITEARGHGSEDLLILDMDGRNKMQDRKHDGKKYFSSVDKNINSKQYKSGYVKSEHRSKGFSETKKGIYSDDFSGHMEGSEGRGEVKRHRDVNFEYQKDVKDDFESSGQKVTKAAHRTRYRGDRDDHHGPNLRKNEMQDASLYKALATKHQKVDNLRLQHEDSHIFKDRNRALRTDNHPQTEQKKKKIIKSEEKSLYSGERQLSFDADTKFDKDTERHTSINDKNYYRQLDRKSPRPKESSRRGENPSDVRGTASYISAERQSEKVQFFRKDAAFTPAKYNTAPKGLTVWDEQETEYDDKKTYVHMSGGFNHTNRLRKSQDELANRKTRQPWTSNLARQKKDGPLSLQDSYGAGMESNDTSQSGQRALSQTSNHLSESSTSIGNQIKGISHSPSKQSSIVRQQSVQSEVNGEQKEEGIKFERLKNLQEDDLLVKVREIVGHLEKLEDYHRGDGMRVQKMLGDMYWDYTAIRETIGDCMADCGYAVASMKMLKTLNGIGIFKNDDVWFPTYYTYNTMWNFTDASNKLAQALADNDAVRLLTLNCGHKPYINAIHSKNVYYVMKSSLSILHNIARNSGMKHLFDENKTSETIMPFLESEDEMLKILATLTIANIVDEEENKSLITDTGTINCIVSWMEKALNLARRRYKGFTPQELTEGLNRLAVNDSNKMKIIEEGALPLFLKMLQHDDVREQSSAARIIWTLSFDKDVRQKIKEFPELVPTLEKLTESTNKSLQTNTTGALWVIRGDNDVSRETRPKSAKSKSHVFLSYSWSDKETVLMIRDKLRAEGYAIWIDVEKMGGSTLEGMATAVENSAVVLICMSEKYKQSPNCRTEAEYTFQLRKDYIPLMMQKKYRPDGWLGIILGAKLYFDFSGKYPFDKSFQGLLKELRGRGKVTPGHTPGDDHTDTSGTITHSHSMSSHASITGTPTHHIHSNSPVLNMGQEELIKWLRNVKLTECIPAFLEFDGKLLMQLKVMREEAPEFFYQCLEKRLNMSLIEILKFTRALEELH